MSLTLTITNNHLYKTTYGIGATINILPLNEISSLTGDYVYYGEAYITVTKPDNTTITISNSTNGGGGGRITLEDVVGSYIIRYSGTNYWQDTNSEFPRSVSVPYSFYYNISVVENHLQLKKWTITDVINRILDLAEPLRQGERSRFRLNAEQAKQFDAVMSPQLSLTKKTLRECLQQVGAVIHGEPRLTPKKERYAYYRTENFTNGKAALGSNNYAPYEKAESYIVYINGREHAAYIESEANGGDDDYYLYVSGAPRFNGTAGVYKLQEEGVKGEYYYEVSYDMYAGTDRAGIYAVPYILKKVSQGINNYASYLDTNAENLVNQLDKMSGVIIEPYAGGWKSVRCENQYVRVTDENMIIATQFPVYEVGKLEYRYKDGYIDVTPWLFEKSIYDTQLSSYDEQYPYSKAYGIYFTQGGKNICGLNFKPDRVLFAAYENYAIVNIIRQATGDEDFARNWVTDQGGGNAVEYPTLEFRVTYTPIYNARIGQTKSNYKDYSLPAALIYNQASNIIETKYYGENLKGLVARLGTVEISKTYHLTRLAKIPKAGQLYDDDHYISAVSVEYLPTLIKCTLGLSKDFNRLSQYIGINSENRYSEVSQTQALERNTLWKEYIVLGDEETPDADSLMGGNVMKAVSCVFTPTEQAAITNVVAWGQTASGKDVTTPVSLPVISTAYGNAVAFSWSYRDNYSAGAKTAKRENNGVSGYWQTDVPYCDYYGRIYYYRFDLRLPEVLADGGAEGCDLPQYNGGVPQESSGYVSTVGKTPYLIRKDNREKLQCNFQIEFVTNRAGLIIGSALAEYCPLVRSKTKEDYGPRLYVLENPLDKFVDSIVAEGITDLTTLPSVGVHISGLTQGGFTLGADDPFPASGKAWAIITSVKAEENEVEDDNGTISVQTEYKGGKVLLAQNMEIVEKQKFTPVSFTAKREIFDKTVWKDRR